MRRLAVPALVLALFAATVPGVLAQSAAPGHGWLLGDLQAVLNGPRPAYAHVRSTLGYGGDDRFDDGISQIASAAALAPEDLILLTVIASGGDGQDASLVIKGLSAASAAAADEGQMLDGILAWQAADWERRFGAVPDNETTVVGDKHVLRTTLDIDPGRSPYPYPYDVQEFVRSVWDTLDPASDQFRSDVLSLGEDAVQYLYVSGDSAIAVTAVDDETAITLLESLP
jgi:hypothetical protein